MEPIARKKPQKLSAELVDSALALLRENPESGLDLRTVCRRAGRAHTAAYTAFGRESDGGGRNALLGAVAARGFKDLLKRFDESAPGGVNSREELESLGRAYVRFAWSNPGLYRLMFGNALRRWMAVERWSPHALRVFDELVSARGQVQNVLQQTIATVIGIDASDPASGEKMLVAWALLHGLVELSDGGQFDLLFEPDGSKDRFVNHSIRWLVSAL